VSSQGDRIAYLRWLGAGWSSIRIADLKSSSNEAVVENAGEPFGMVWVPSSDRLIYSSDPSRTADGKAILTLISLDTNGAHRAQPLRTVRQIGQLSRTVLGLSSAFSPIIVGSSRSGQSKIAIISRSIEANLFAVRVGQKKGEPVDVQQTTFDAA